MDTLDTTAMPEGIYTNGVYGSFGVVHKADPNPNILINSVDLSQPEHTGILWCMRYLVRIRKLVKIVYEETNDEIWATLDAQDARPTVTVCLSRFEKLDKKYSHRTAMIALAMATKQGYLSLDKSKSETNFQRVIVTGDGLILLTRTGWVNALAGSIGKVSSVGSWLVSILALGVAVYAVLHHK